MIDGQLVALLPGNIHEGVYYSHQWLTFGGLISIPNIVRASDVVRLFEEVVRRLAITGVKKLIYKSLPSIYQSTPSQEDVYALFRIGAGLERVELTTTIDNSTPRIIGSRRRRGSKKAASAGITFEESLDWQSFWSILVGRLKERHGVLPVHSVEEIMLLAERFPANIRLFISIPKAREVCRRRNLRDATGRALPIHLSKS